MTEAPETTEAPGTTGPVDVHAPAAHLASATASLDAHIAAAADRIAGPRIAAAEAGRRTRRRRPAQPSTS